MEIGTKAKQITSKDTPLRLVSHAVSNISVRQLQEEKVYTEVNSMNIFETTKNGLNRTGRFTNEDRRLLSTLLEP